MSVAAFLGDCFRDLVRWFWGGLLIYSCSKMEPVGSSRTLEFACFITFGFELKGLALGLADWTRPPVCRLI